MTDRKRLAVAVGLTPVYAVCYSLIKLGLSYAPPLRYGALRALAAAFALLALLFVSRSSVFPPRRLWPGVVGIAATGTLIAYGAMFLAPGRTGAGIASVLGNTTPLFTLGLAMPLLGERLTRAKLGSLVLGFGGASLIAAPALTDPSHHGAESVLLPLGAAAGFAISSVVVKRIDATGAELQIAAWQLLLGGAALFGVSILAEPRDPIRWTPVFVAMLAFLALIGTALTTAVWYWLVQRDDVGRLSLVLFLIPALGLALAVVLFDERLTAGQGLGVALVLAALGLLLRTDRRVAHGS